MDVTTGGPGTDASASTNGDVSNPDFSFIIPRGDIGLTPIISIVDVTTGGPGTDASASTNGDVSNPDFSFIIPRGDIGLTPIISIVDVSTGGPGTDASASTNGDVSNPDFSFIIPRGDKGDTGTIEANYYNGNNATFTVDETNRHVCGFPTITFSITLDGNIEKTSGYLDISAADISLNGNITLGSAGTTTTITFDGSVNSDIIPNTNATYSLGTSDLGYKGLQLGSDGYIDFSNGDISLVHVPNQGLMIKNGVDSSYQLQFENSYASIGKVNGTTDHRLILTSSGEDFVLPGTNGSSTEVLTTDGNGVLSWSVPGGASSVDISSVSNDQNYDLVFTTGSGKKPLNIDTSNNILYNPSTNLLTVSGLYATGDIRELYIRK